MRVLAACAAMLALAGCVHHNFSEGERESWRCAGGKEFSLRMAGGEAEVYAAGQTHRLAPAPADGRERSYSNGEASYTVSGGRAALAGVPGGPFESCRRSGGPRLW